MQRETVLFDSWWGKYSDNPRAISEELTRRGSPLRQVWVLDGPNPEAPEGATLVRMGSAKHLMHLGSARYVVANNTLPQWFRKRKGTVQVQTWHGTPLKRIAFDILNPTAAVGENYRRMLSRQVAGWDFLISPNRFSTEVFRRAFRYSGEILETGYPRNDLLTSPQADEVREKVRRRLGIPAESTAVLYAPTWRDNATFSTPLDLSRLADELGNGYRVLLRAHHVVAETVRANPHPCVLDVSRLHEVRDLYLAADVLVTDYSSAMFDFAVTGKPILLFPYDLSHYRDELRGFYLDLEAEAPGPLLTTLAEIAEALRDPDGASDGYGARYQAFQSRYCSLEDGHAAARVVDRVFVTP